MNPNAFSIGPLTVKWYGILISLGFLLAVLYAVRQLPRFGVRENAFLDLLIFGTPIAVACARIYYVVFRYVEFEEDFLRIFRIWEGGLAIYGAVIGAVLTVLVGCKLKKINVWALLDVLSLGLLIGQCVGRWGNFVNGECYGSPTTLPWRMMVNGVSAHPAFLYESLWTLAGFLLLHFFVLKRRKFNGQIFLTYIAWYGLGRGMIEGLREDSLFFFNTPLRVSQVLGFASCVVAVVILFLLLVFRRYNPDALLTSSPFGRVDRGLPGGDAVATLKEDGALSCGCEACSCVERGMSGEGEEYDQAEEEEGDEPEAVELENASLDDLTE